MPLQMSLSSQCGSFFSQGQGRLLFETIAQREAHALQTVANGRLRGYTLRWVKVTQTPKFHE